MARQTAVVLGDESLLVPVLQALPEGIEEANVTMGLPLYLTLPYAGVEVFLQLHEAREQNRGSYPRRLLEATLIHPFAAMMVANPSALVRAQFELRRARRAHWSAAQVEALLGADATLWRPAHDPRQLVQELAKRTAHWLSVPRPAWEGEPARAVLQILERLQGMLPDEVLGVGSLLRLYRSLATESPVAFFGEPFNGLQIMGLLETRALDFKRLIVAPLNEGVLPQGRSTASFLPFDLRKAYGLPLPQDRESVAAYHLYRLMQRAETVVMVVNSEPDGLGKGEASRWVRQAQLELARYPGVRVTDRRLNWPPAPRPVSARRRRRAHRPRSVAPSRRRPAAQGSEPHRIPALSRGPLPLFGAQRARDPRRIAHPRPRRGRRPRNRPALRARATLQDPPRP